MTPQTAQSINQKNNSAIHSDSRRWMAWIDNAWTVVEYNYKTKKAKNLYSGNSMEKAIEILME